jgi:hypothetical protein
VKADKPKALIVEVERQRLIVTLEGTSYRAVYRLLPDKSRLIESGALAVLRLDFLAASPVCGRMTLEERLALARRTHQAALRERQLTTRGQDGAF